MRLVVATVTTNASSLMFRLDQMQYKDKVLTHAEANMGNTSSITHHICIDTDSAISITDSAYVRKYIPPVTVHPSSTIRS
jgi:hypothetical protein